MGNITLPIHASLSVFRLGTVQLLVLPHLVSHLGHIWIVCGLTVCGS